MCQGLRRVLEVFLGLMCLRVLSEIIMAWQVTQELELHIKGISFSMNIVFYHLLGIGFHFEQNESTAERLSVCSLRLYLAARTESDIAGYTSPSPAPVVILQFLLEVLAWRERVSLPGYQVGGKKCRNHLRALVC